MHCYNLLCIIILQKRIVNDTRLYKFKFKFFKYNITAHPRRGISFHLGVTSVTIPWN